MHRPVTPALFVAFALLAAACGGGSAPPGGPSGGASPAVDATLGPAGGTVTSPDHHAVLTVPAGALSGTVGLTVRATTQAPLDPSVVDHTVYEVGPPGTTFAAPATLALDFDRNRAPSGVDESELRLHTLAGGAWQPVAGAVTPRGGDATGTVGAAGVYGVRWIGPGASCSGPHDGDFDFWLGSWDFHQGNLPVAGNEITKEAGGCLVEEHFQDPAGGRAQREPLQPRRRALAPDLHRLGRRAHRARGRARRRPHGDVQRSQRPHDLGPARREHHPLLLRAHGRRRPELEGDL